MVILSKRSIVVTFPVGKEETDIDIIDYVADDVEGELRLELERVAVRMRRKFPDLRFVHTNK